MLASHKVIKIIPVILAGGLGSRLWPLSRESHPKPFIKLDDGQSLIQKTYLRAIEFANVGEIVTVTNRELFFYTRDEYDAFAVDSINNTFILEPVGRNSAAAIALAAQHVCSKYNEDAIILVLPADHMIGNISAFKEAVEQAVNLATTNKLVTFGVQPNAPKTAYGYIEAQGNTVLRFIEKPALEQAQEYCKSGNYLWNAGMFCMRVGTLLDEIKLHAQYIYTQSKRCMLNAKVSEGFNWLQKEVRIEDFESVENISIDYAIFEKSTHIAVVPCDIAWTDVGSWLEFGQMYPTDAHGNHISGVTVLNDVRDCIIHAGNKLVAGINLQDLVIVNTVDAILIADRKSTQDVGKIVKTLKEQEHECYKLFPTAHRPWGSYTVLQEAPGFKVKRIEVKPGAALSLQSHDHRSEHWVIIQGVANVINAENELQVQQHQSVYIPIGNKHRLSNPGPALLILIEVQLGDYLGEDDITRYNDVYGRVLEAVG